MPPNSIPAMVTLGSLGEMERACTYGLQSGGSVGENHLNFRARRSPSSSSQDSPWSPLTALNSEELKTSNGLNQGL